MWNVIITCYNYAPLLGRAIESIPNARVIVVNDASTDNTVEVASKYDVLLINNRKNMGVAESRNIGAELCRSKYLLFLDADDYLGGGFLEEAEKQLEEYDIVRPNVCFFGKKDYTSREYSFSLSDFYKSNRAPISSPMKYGVWETLRFKDRSRFEDYDFWLEAAKLYKFGTMDKDLHVFVHDKSRSDIPVRECEKEYANLARIHGHDIQGYCAKPGLPKVSILTPYMTLGGVEMWAINLIKYSKLDWNGIGITVGKHKYKPYLEEFDKLDVPVYTSKSEIQKMVDESDLVICANDDIDFEIDRKKLVLVSHGSSDWTRERLDKVKHRCDHWVAVGQACQKPFGNSVKVIPNGVDPAHCIPYVPREKVLKDWNIPNSAKVACYYGRFAEEKNLIELVKAAGDYYVVLVGLFPPDYEGRLKRELVNSELVRVVPAYEHAGEFLSAVDVFVLPSIEEGNCLALLEAMMANIPCLCTPVGAVNELEYQGAVFSKLPLNPISPDIKEGLKYITGKSISCTAMEMAANWDTYLREIHESNFNILFHK